MQLKQENIHLLSLCGDYCNLILEAESLSAGEFISKITELLPDIYSAFVKSNVEDEGGDDFSLMQSQYVDEDYYNAVRLRLETLFGPDDTFLETFEEDMKYSDTPIAASISESLADIFQPLYNFSESVRESEGDAFASAFAECRESFDEYWSQILCNVMRPLNQLRLNPELNQIP